jgi:protease secretion system outer membrane protein
MQVLNPIVSLALIFGLFIPGASYSSNLLSDYQAARKNDAAFAASFADYQTGNLQARMAGSAYYPEGKFSRSQLSNESSDRQTLSITQPLLSADRWLSLKEVEPRSGIAETTLSKNQNELAQRLFKVVSALSDARERLLLNQVNIEALQAQTESAQRAYQLGMGTVTDVYDAQVRIAQARSLALSLRASLQAAERQYDTMVGVRPLLSSYTLVKQMPELKLPALDSFLDQARRGNSSIRQSELATQLGEITRKRSKAVYLPSINAAMQRSQSGDSISTSAGVALRLEIPLDMGGYLRWQTADLDLQKLRDTERQVKQQVELDIQRLYSEVESSLLELSIRAEGIKAAEQSVNANEQSFKGGVRSKLDVLNALQALHQSKSDYVTALLQLGERLLSLQINGAVDMDLALKQVQAQLFQP